MCYFFIFQVFNHPLMHGPGLLGYLQSRPPHSQHIANTAYPNHSPVSGTNVEGRQGRGSSCLRKCSML